MADRQFYDNLLVSIEALFTEDLAWEEAHWSEEDDFMRSEFLHVNVEDAFRRLGWLRKAHEHGELLPEQVEHLYRVEKIVHEAGPRIRKLTETMKHSSATLL